MVHEQEVSECLHLEAGIDYSKELRRNLSVAELYEDALRYEPGTFMSSAGALITSSGAKTGRSPSDKRLVEEEDSKENIWVGLSTL
jgi:phosphoenolpyruvate carboxykinase (ATP)